MAIPSKQRAIMDKHLKGAATSDDDDDDDDLEVVSPPEKSTVTALDDEDDVPEVTDPSGNVIAERRQSRAEKKQNRFSEANERADEARAFAEQQSQINQRLIETMERIGNPGTTKEKPKDPMEAELESTQQALDLLAARVDAAGGKITREQEQEFIKQARELRAKETRLHARLAIREERGASEPQRQITPQDMRREAEIGALQSEYADVYSYTKVAPDGRRVAPGLKWAQANWQMRMAKAGLDPEEHAHTPQAAKFRREALNEARREFGLGNSRDVSDGQRKKYGGTNSGGTGSGRAPKNVTMTATDEKMMNARWKHIRDPKERIKLWQKHIASKRT